MGRTIRRQPFSVSTKSSDYPTSYNFIHAEFKGIYDAKNDVTVDQYSFADAHNVYVDTDGLLTSRPPFKFLGTNRNIVEEWTFGRITVCLYRMISDATFDFTFRVTDGDSIVEKTYNISMSVIGSDNPNAMCVQIEDKIFIWFDNKYSTVYLTTKKIFTDMSEHLYIPITTQVVNDLEQKFEDANFLTSSYRRRYLYSLLSDVNFDRLIGKEMSVSTAGSHLYDIYVQTHQEDVLLRPYSNIGNDYHIDVVQTATANVFMRYSLISHGIEVSFDGNIYKALPRLNGIVGTPMLTRDGFWVVAFTENKGIAKCKLASQSYEDFVDTDSLFVWSFDNYYRETSASREQLPDLKNIPTGYFETINQFVYITWNELTTGGALSPYYYAEWEHGTEREYIFKPLISFAAGNYYHDNFSTDDIKVKFRYIGDSAIDYGVRILITILTQGYRDEEDIYGAGLLTVICTYNGSNIVESKIYNEIDQDEFAIACAQADIHVSDPYLDHGFLTYDIHVATGLQGGYDYIGIFSYWPEEAIVTKKDDKTLRKHSTFFVIGESGEVLTDKYLSKDGVITYLPGIEQADNAVIKNGDTIRLAYTDYVDYTGEVIAAEGNIHLIDENRNLIDGPIKNGSLVVLSNCAYTEKAFLTINDITVSGSIGRAIEKNCFVINSLSGSEYLYQGDLIQLSAVLPVESVPNDYIGNPTTKELSLTRWDYPSSDNITHDGTWPYDEWQLPKPYLKRGDKYILWDKYEPYPTGAVHLGGTLSIVSQIRPLLIGTDGVWYNINGKLWTSRLDTDTLIELTETISGDVKLDVPTHSVTLNEHYFSFDTDDGHLLEVSSTRRSDENLTEFLLYLPSVNEQKFTSHITNLHSLSNTEIGVFTETDIWYVGTTSLDDGTVYYTKPIKSKIPFGCREGDDVMTAFDGQAIIFPTPRGITVMAPQELVATTDMSLSYMSNAIQGKYESFYRDDVINATRAFDNEPSYKAQIKIVMYNYWMLFYKYMDREILVFDTRNSSWWIWSTPYPIKQLNYINGELHAIFQVDGTPSSNDTHAGVKFILMSHGKYLSYKDDIIKDTISGAYKLVDGRKQFKYASAIIPWHLTSQKLHFNQINNYKAIKGLTFVVNGVEAFAAKLSTHAYRDTYHPEQDLFMEIGINDLRTFIKRLNLLHVMNFQYTLENSDSADTHYPLKLNSLTIKYEVKEKIR